MKIFFIIIIFFLSSCSNTNKKNKITEIDFDQNLSFIEFKELIEINSSEKNFPNINE
tara:strand:+ start:876 stop:1046 length:171 start_codon:yes stop_codon:yes gene_type:complete